MDINTNQSNDAYTKQLFKQMVSADPIIFNYMVENTETNTKTFEELCRTHSHIKMREMFIEVGKTVVKNVLVNTKSAVVNMPAEIKNSKTIQGKILKGVTPLFRFIEPENISTRLSDDEKLILLNDIKNKKAKGNTNLYVVIGTNILMSLVSTNISQLFNDDDTNKTKDIITTTNFDDLYSKVKIVKEEDGEKDDTIVNSNKRKLEEEEEGIDDINHTKRLHLGDDVENMGEFILENEEEEELTQINNIITDEDERVEANTAIEEEVTGEDQSEIVEEEGEPIKEIEEEGASIDESIKDYSDDEPVVASNNIGYNIDEETEEIKRSKIDDLLNSYKKRAYNGSRRGRKNKILSFE